ncbi:hypothetical protein OQI89_12540 [Lentilactobacillus diolivorans]|uniref:hypothetical protein n=1 Tax=Lentilactobacillus diolivorans TaxID=179838 RepID=UPI0024687107|nr:hypothetical protein [Lentilactobacillus diolivorans]MDH5106680.1 hypothetical protein [Lentilactobacillus diolivorans]
MRGHFKLAVLTALLFASAGVFGVASSANADGVIEAPGSAGSIKQVNAGNVLKDYNEEALNTVNNSSPQGNTSKKYTKYTLDESGYNYANSYNTIDGSSQTNTFKTKWFLPDGFNVSNYQHGNFQSVSLDGNGNLYFVESNGTNTNQGAIVKFDMAKLQQLGVNDDVLAIWKAFDYFNPYTTEGTQHNQEYEDAYNQMQGSFDQIKTLTNTLNQNKSWQNNQLNYQKTAQKWYFHWKTKKANNQKTVKSNTASYVKKQNAKKVVKQATAKMARWMKSYQMHKKKVANYNTKITGIQNQINTYQSQVDAVKAQNPDMFKYVDIAQTATLSPQVDIGHGQTLSFNPQNQHLYLAKDNTLTDLASRDDNNTVLEMDPNTLKPIREYNFKMYHGDSANLQLHTLAFDKNGNAYWGRKLGKGYMFFYGRLDENGVSFQASSSMVGQRGGTTNQGVAVNPQNNRLYFISDDILTSIPTSQIQDGSFKASDIHYQAFNSGREFESLAFDQDGYGYLLALWPPELMQSTAPLN